MPIPAVLLAASLFPYDLKVDHITIAGRDLKQLQARFEKAGIHGEYGGKHTNGLTEMAVASFPDGSYLELIAAQKPEGAAAHYWGKFIDGDGGPCAWAISKLEMPGVKFAKSGRLRPDGAALEWESASLGPEPQGTFFPFMIHDLTPRELRAYPNGKPSETKYSGVAMVVIGVKDLDGAIQRYREMFHFKEPERQKDEQLRLNLAVFTGTPVVLASPDKGESPLATRLAKFGEAPYLFVLDKAPGGGLVGMASKWFGRTIFWDLASGIGIRIPISTSR